MKSTVTDKEIGPSALGQPDDNPDNTGISRVGAQQHGYTDNDHLLTKVRRQLGFTPSDNQAPIFSKRKAPRLRYQGANAGTRTNVLHEVEVILNGTTIDSPAVRSRYKRAAIHDHRDATKPNFARDALRMLGYFGWKN
jgi:hypothetical protein